jgi:hypothetical protein
MRLLAAMLFSAAIALAQADINKSAVLALAEQQEQMGFKAEVSPDGSCLAVVEETELTVLDAQGKIVWKKPYINRWMEEAVNQWWDGKPMAVAPRCRWLAVGGSASYKYVWLFNSHGEPRAHLATPGTPKALAISHKGDLLAVGTAAGHLLLVNPRGEIQKDITLSDTLYIIDELQFSPDDALLLTTQAGGTTALLTKAGEPLWTRDQGFWMTTTVTPDWERFLVVGLPGHGEMVGHMELVSRDGRTLWKDSALYPIVSVTPDGRNFVVASEPLQGYESEEAATFLLPRTILDRDGKVIPSEGPKQ